MNSRDAINLLVQKGKQPILREGKARKQQEEIPTVEWEGMSRHSTDGANYITPITDRPLPGTDYDGKLTNRTGGSRTNYDGKPNLASLPLSLRRRMLTTADPGPERHLYPSVMPQSRNVGCVVWRRYSNGKLDERDAVTKLREALRKYRMGSPINEIDALVITSVFPEYRFQNLTPEIIRVKAYLDQTEGERLRDWNNQLEKEEALRMVVDLGGA